MLELIQNWWQPLAEDPVKLAAMLVGAAAVIENAFLYVPVKRERIIVLKLISDLMWAVNYLLLGKFTGTALNTIAAARECVFYQRGKYKWADSVLWVGLFIMLVLISPVLEWLTAGVFTVVPLLAAVGSTILVVALFQKNTRVIKLMTLAGLVLWLTYAALSGNVPGVVNNLVCIVSCVIGIVREFRTAEPAQA